LTATLKLPRVLAQVANAEMAQPVDGDTLAEALASLFRVSPGLRGHILTESGEIRPHVSVFVDGAQAGLGTPVGVGSEIRVLQAVSGGSGSGHSPCV